MAARLRVGWFSFTCSEDSTIVFIELMNSMYFRWKKCIDFRHFNTLRKKGDMKNLDVAFVEGAISGKEEEKRLREIRRNCRKLVAVGNCACVGVPSNQRNSFDSSRMEEIRPVLRKFGLREKVSAVSDIVKVDDKVPGCPMDEKIFLEKLEGLLGEFGISSCSKEGTDSPAAKNPAGSPKRSNITR